MIIDIEQHPPKEYTVNMKLTTAIVKYVTRHCLYSHFLLSGMGGGRCSSSISSIVI